MKAVGHRLRRLENQFGVTGEEQILVSITGVRRRALDNKACVEILRESGYLRGGRIRVIRLIDIPDGLDAVELAKFLREHGGKIT
jgi:hypothetical protein